MTEPRISPLKQALVTTAGGFLRNPVKERTCGRCFTPIATGTRCGKCEWQVGLSGGPDLLGIMAYAGHLDPISQSGYVMRGYKNLNIPDSSKAVLQQTVTLLAALGLRGHVGCPGKILGIPVTAWATVPSLPPKPSAHPLSDIVRSLARPGSIEVILRGRTNGANPRDVDAGHFSVVTGDAAGQHILLIDDTWTGGGHATSAAMALRTAGCAKVSLLVLARWLSIGWEATTDKWAKSALALPDYQADVCPWNQGQCPIEATGPAA